MARPSTLPPRSSAPALSLTVMAGEGEEDERLWIARGEEEVSDLEEEAHSRERGRRWSQCRCRS